MIPLLSMALLAADTLAKLTGRPSGALTATIRGARVKLA
jgi:hypothetical protein